MKDTLKKNKIALSFLIFATLACLFYLFALRNLYSDINEKQEKIQEKIAEREITEEKIRSLPEIREKISSIKEEENKIKNLISKDQAVELIKELENLAENTGNEINFSIIEQDKNKKKDDKKKDPEIKIPSENYLEIKISLEGNESSVFNFIKKMENIHYWNDIISIQIKTFEKEMEAAASIGTSPVPETNSEKAKKKYHGITADLDTVFYTEN